MTLSGKILTGAVVAAALAPSAAKACYYPDDATFRAEEEAHARLLRESHRVEATFSLPGGYPEEYGEVEANLLNERNGKTLPLVVDTSEMLNGCSRVHFPKDGQRGTFYIQRKNDRFEFVQFKPETVAE